MAAYVDAHAEDSVFSSIARVYIIPNTAALRDFWRVQYLLIILQLWEFNLQ